MCCTGRASKSSNKLLLDFTNLKFHFKLIDYLNKILSSKWFLPWSRLGMGFYLSQLTVITRRILTFRHNFYVNDQTIVRGCFKLFKTLLISINNFRLVIFALILS